MPTHNDECFPSSAIHVDRILIVHEFTRAHDVCTLESHILFNRSVVCATARGLPAQHRQVYDRTPLIHVDDGFTTPTV